MRKACLKRVLCYACCLSLVLGVFAYRPAKAEAVFVSPMAALGASLIASVVVGTTATFFVESGAADDIGEAIDFLLEEYISVMDELTTYTPQDICEIVGNGASMLENGVIQLSSHAGNLTAGFINWLREEKGLEAGGAVLPILSNSVGTVVIDGSTVRLSVIGKDGSYSLTGISAPLGGSFSIGNCSYSISGQQDTNAFYTRYDVVNGSNANWDYWLTTPKTNDVVNVFPAIFEGDSSYLYAILQFKDGSLGEEALKWLPSSGGLTQTPPFSNVTFQNEEFSLQPNSEFQEIPAAIPEGQILSIDIGLSALPQDDPQAMADAIMGAINAGILSPSVSIEGHATDIPGTDTDDDAVIAVPGADADLLDWTKYIGQKVASIPKAIGQSVAEAVAAAFSPDPKLVNEITGAFSAKFGFVETLKRIGDDLFGMTAASEPPVVWIHLEDAEGRYEYGGTVKALDMSWYQRYKEDMDRILGGFLWVAYCWLLFKRAPDILSGAGMAAAESQYIDDHQMVSGQWIKVRRSKRL